MALALLSSTFSTTTWTTTVMGNAATARMTAAMDRPFPALLSLDVIRPTIPEISPTRAREQPKMLNTGMKASTKPNTAKTKPVTAGTFDCLTSAPDWCGGEVGGGEACGDTTCWSRDTVVA